MSGIWKGFWKDSILLPGIRLVGSYRFNTGTTGNLSYELRYYFIDQEGNRVPSIGYVVHPYSYSYGQNDITLTSGTYSKDVSIFVEETFTTPDTSALSFIVHPSVPATLSGGAWSLDVPSVSANTNYTLTNLDGNANFYGDNTVNYLLVDPNNESFSADNTSVIRYAPDIYIVAVDGNTDVLNDVETSEYQVDLTYVLGGIFTTSAGLSWTGGTSAIEPAVSLSPGDNTLVLGPFTDDFGNNKNSYPQIVTKVPTIAYTGVSAVDAETYGTSYTATSALLIDSGIPYETSADVSFSFTNNDYRTYTFNKIYTYPTTTVSAGITIPIKYKRYSSTRIISPVDGQLFNDTSPITVNWVDFNDNDISDTENLGDHTYATNVPITRTSDGSLDIVTVSHKTGIPTATLKSYYTDVNDEVLFTGSYVVPPEVSNPIKFGWSVTNGNVQTEVSQTTFTQSLTLSADNDVIMPEFTDNWGNTIPLVNRTKSVFYGTVLYEEIPQVQNLVFDQIGTGDTLVEDVPQFESLVFDQNGIGEQIYGSPSVIITYPTNGSTIYSNEIIADTLDLTWNLDGIPQEDVYVFDSGTGNYQIHVSYVDPVTELIGYNTVNVQYEVV